jgi:hypothetical protein
MMGCFISKHEDELYFFNKSSIPYKLLIVTSLENLAVNLYCKIDEINSYDVCIVTVMISSCGHYSLSFDGHDTREKMDKWISLIVDFHEMAK